MVHRDMLGSTRARFIDHLLGAFSKTKGVFKNRLDALRDWALRTKRKEGPFTRLAVKHVPLVFEA